MPSPMRILSALSKFVDTKSVGDLNTPLERPIRLFVALTTCSLEGNLNNFAVML